MPVGSSKDCICTSSSLTTPPTPSDVIDRFCTEVAAQDAPANADGSPVIPPQSIDVMRAASGIVVALTPPRAIAIASISSMKPMAPPSWRAALRSALK